MVAAIDFAVRDFAGGSQLGSVAGEGQGNFIQVGSGDSISLNLSRASIIGYEKQGNDLVIQLADGRSILLSGYFDEAAVGQNKLYLSDNGTITEVLISNTGDGALFAEYGAVQGWDKWSPLDDLRFADADGVAGAVGASDEPAGMAALVPGLMGGAGGLGAAAAVVGGAAVIGGGGGGSNGGGTGGDGGGDDNDDDDDTGGDDDDDNDDDTGDDDDDGDDDGDDDTRRPPTVDAQDADPLTTNTTNPSITVTGTGEPGDRVKVTIGGVIEETTIRPNGTWSVTYPSNGLPGDGSHSATVVVTQPNGVTHNLTGPGFIIDMTPPAVQTTFGTTTQNDIENLAEYANGVSLGGTGEVGANIQVVINGHTQTTTVGQNGQWSVTFAKTQIAAGEHYELPAVITATDALGNKTALNQTIAIDTLAEVDVTQGQIGGDDRMTLSESRSFNLIGTADPGATVKVTFEGQTMTVTANGDGAWTAPFAFANFGLATRTGMVQVQATDTAGNTATTSHTIQIDTEVQNFRLTAVDDLSSLAAGADAVNAMEALNGVTITGTVEPGSTVTVKWGDMTLPASAVTVGANGVWTATVPASAIPAGQTSVQVTATARDQYDNLSSTLTQNVAIDRIVTPLTRGGGQIGGDGYINAAEAAAGVTLTGTVEANSTVWVRVNNGAPIETTATANGTWSITVPKNRLPEGNDIPVTVQVSARDWVGNVRHLDAETVRVDTVAPADPVRVGDAGMGNQLIGIATAVSADDYTYHTVNAAGTATEITPASEFRGTVDVNGQTVNANWAMFGAAVPDGTYLVINNEDAAGNESSTLYLRNTTGEVVVDLSRSGLQTFDFGTIDLSAADANLTITPAQILALTGADKQLTVVGGTDDIVNISGVTGVANAPDGFKLYTLGANGPSVLIDEDIQVNATGV
jgi:hypothetical protein